MRRSQLVAVVVVLALAAFIVVLALRNRQAPRLPADEVHARFTGGAACLECHDFEGGPPRSRNHPLGEDCLRCHGRR